MIAKRWFNCLVWLAVSSAGHGETWSEALAAMPVPTTQAVNRSNAMAAVLGAYRPNPTVRAIIFLPGVSDDYYLIHRDAPALNVSGSNLFEWIAGLTNRTPVKATFRAPFLLLHTVQDQPAAQPVVHHPKTVADLEQGMHWPGVLLVDRHWERLQPELGKRLGLKIEPEGRSKDAWHFHRHHLVGGQLSDWELLEAIAISGKTRFRVFRGRVVFDQPNLPTTGGK